MNARKLVSLALLFVLLGCGGFLLLMRMVMGLFREALESMGGVWALQEPFAFLAAGSLAAAALIVAGETILHRREKSGSPAAPEQDEKWLTVYLVSAGLPVTGSVVYVLFLAGMSLLVNWDTQERMIQILKRQKSEITALRERLDAALPTPQAKPAHGRGSGKR